jgi:hypothetical protein
MFGNLICMWEKCTWTYKTEYVIFGYVRLVTSDEVLTYDFLAMTYALHEGRAMTRAVTLRLFTAESRVNPYGICAGQSGTGAGSSPSSSVSPCHYQSTVVLYTHISSWDEQAVRTWQQFRDVVSPPSKSTMPYTSLHSGYLKYNLCTWHLTLPISHNINKLQIDTILKCTFRSSAWIVFIKVIYSIFY